MTTKEANARRLAGWCSACLMVIPEKPHTLCPSCSAKQKAARAAAKAKGLCMNCKVRPAIEGKSCCTDCTRKKHEWYARTHIPKRVTQYQVDGKTYTRYEMQEMRRDDYLKRRRAKARVDGLCSSCMRREAEAGKLCPVCRERQERYRRERANSGTCIVCGERPAVTGRRNCAQCAAYLARLTRNKRKQAQEANRCWKCGRLNDNGRQLCNECSEVFSNRAKARVEELKAQGLCYMCGKVPADEGMVSCEACREKRRRQLLWRK